jgi:hypothetical protein
LMIHVFDVSSFFLKRESHFSIPESKIERI